MGPWQRLWWRWKTLRLPWRKRYLIGMDLAGNTFWELHLHDSLSRPRRIAQPGHKRLHHSDMKISPQWHQWLRHTRDDAPTVQEQLSDVQRLANIKRLARIADERWASKPSLLDGPDRRRRKTAPEAQLENIPAQDTSVDAATPRRETPVAEASRRRGAPGEDWQPEAWSPGAGPSKQ
ncbi:MAG: hypothetical protein M1815_005158 [Lichina confinis]|nr:MAG: hypothetical protein M1815_005158 [Lichina confinis]